MSKFSNKDNNDDVSADCNTVTFSSKTAKHNKASTNFFRVKIMYPPSIWYGAYKNQIFVFVTNFNNSTWCGCLIFSEILCNKSNIIVSKLS